VGVLPGIGNGNSSSSEDSNSEADISVKSEVVRWKSFLTGQSGKVLVNSLGWKEALVCPCKQEKLKNVES